MMPLNYFAKKLSQISKQRAELEAIIQEQDEALEEMEQEYLKAVAGSNRLETTKNMEKTFEL